MLHVVIIIFILWLDFLCVRNYRNRLRPAFNADYSILDLGDTIKSLSNAETFQYMLDANQRRHWGGIFEAPMSYRYNTFY